MWKPPQVPANALTSDYEPPKILEPPVRKRYWEVEIPPTLYGIGLMDYKGRYLPQFPSNSISDYLFGRVAKFEGDAAQHPCTQVANNFHRCLDDHQNKFDFCRSTFNIFEGCLREYKL